jgi:outer membrane protein OmpA-like peptidoglycan-associated protein
MGLSNRRAHAAVDYLVSKGISRSRLKSKGYGETKLLNKCADGVQCTEEEHKVNRRTEFKFTKPIKK